MKQRNSADMTHVAVAVISKVHLDVVLVGQEEVPDGARLRLGERLAARVGEGAGRPAGTHLCQGKTTLVMARNST